MRRTRGQTKDGVFCQLTREGTIRWGKMRRLENQLALVNTGDHRPVFFQTSRGNAMTLCICAIA